jgi:hypothetical protein
MSVFQSRSPYPLDKAGPQLRNGGKPESSLQHYLRPRSAERISAGKLSANVGSHIGTPPFQFLNCIKKDQINSRQNTGQSTPTNWVKPNQHRGRARIRSQSRARTVSPTTSKSRIHSPVSLEEVTHWKSPVRMISAESAACRTSLQHSSEHSPAGLVTSMPPTVCRFSHEDYKHVQFIEWLGEEQ